MKIPILMCAMLLVTYSMAIAQENPEDEHGVHDHHDMEEVVVRATPLQRNLEEMSQSATVISGSALAREASASLGDTLTHVPGLTNASFGQNVGRPVIRGLQGQRVGVLQNNMASGDASAVSQDHAVSIEPFLADQIEILRGPTTLLYGSGAIAGVVNTVTHTIPPELPEVPFSGRAIAQIDSAANQRFGAGRLDFGRGNFAFHVNAFFRRTDDYEIPGETELYPDEDDEEHEEGHGILENSFLDNEGGTMGAGWIGEDWRGGFSLTTYDSNYGIPGAQHHHHEDGQDGDSIEEDVSVTIDLETSRWDGEIAGTEPFPGIEQLELKVAGIDYTHTEFEGSEVGTVFDSDTVDARLELRHAPWHTFAGTFGMQYRDVDFAAAGEEAFVPDSNTTTAALFWLESFESGNWQFDAGLRYEDLEIKLPDSGETGIPQGDEHGDLYRGANRRNFNPFSLSIGAVWHLAEHSHLSLSLAQAERAPTAQELFSFGSHVASQTFEVGNPDLGMESNLHGEVAYRIHGEALDATFILYSDSFSDYIYQENTGEETNGLPVRLWSQQDASFIGGEVELRYDLGVWRSGHWQAFGFYDYVKAELDDGSRVPLMPPRRFGAGIDWDNGDWNLHVAWVHASSQTRVADYETPTPGYDLVNAELSWLIPTVDAFNMEAFLKGRNLLDEDVRNSTSHLKDQAPQAGRNFILGLRAKF